MFGGNIIWYSTIGKATSGTHDHNVYYNVYDASGNIVTAPTETGSYSADPKFTNPGSPTSTATINTGNDFNILVGSPAIDHGITMTGYSLDILGNTVPYGSGPDIGPYEYGSSGGGGGTTLAAPTNFRRIQ